MRRRKAWMPNKTGKRVDRGRTLPGYYVDWHDPRHRTKHFDTQRQAKQWMIEFNRALSLHALDALLISSPSFDDAVLEFLGGLSGVTKGTRKIYARCLAILGNSMPEGIMLDRIKGTHIDNFLGFLRFELEVSEATVGKYWRHVKRFFNWGINRDYLRKSPFGAATSPPQASHERERPEINLEDLERLLNACETIDQWLMVQLGITTGLDRSVLENLRADQIRDGCIKIRRPKTKNKVRVPIHASLRPYLEELCKEAGRRPILRGIQRSHGRDSWWYPILLVAQLPPFYFRDLRAYGNLWGQGVIQFEERQKMLGHSQPSTTYKHYMPLDPGLAKRLDGLPLLGSQVGERLAAAKSIPFPQPASA